MAHGFLRVAAATNLIKIADCHFNFESILQVINNHKRQFVDLLFFPELSLTGATCGDLFFQQSLCESAENKLKELIKESQDLKITVGVGLPFAVRDKIYNGYALFGGGRLHGIVGKPQTTLTTSLGEERNFSPAPLNPITITLAGQQIPFGSRLLFNKSTLEGSFTFAVELGEPFLDSSTLSEELTKAGAQLLIHPAATPYTAGKGTLCRRQLTAQSHRLQVALLYLNAGNGESSSDFAFAGQQLYAETGELLRETQPFEGDSLVYDVDFFKINLLRRHHPRPYEEQPPFVFIETEEAEVFQSTNLEREISPHPFWTSEEKAREISQEILKIQGVALIQRLRQTKMERVVLGLSGGSDSTLALLAVVEAFDKMGLPRKQIHCITMPGYGTTETTKTIVDSLAKEVGVSLETISIHQAVAQHFQDIGHDPTVQDTVYENSQARERTQILMDKANALNALVIGTGDLSELALGWTTFNGDHMSTYSVNGSIPKTMVFRILKTVAESVKKSQPNLAKILEAVLELPISPELLPPKEGKIQQNTEKIIGSYLLHDFFLYYVLGWGFKPKRIFEMALVAFSQKKGYNISTEEIFKSLELFYRRFFQQQFKRNCLPDGVQVGELGLSPRGSWRMPSDSEVALWKIELEDIDF